MQFMIIYSKITKWKCHNNSSFQKKEGGERNGVSESVSAIYVFVNKKDLK